MSILGRALDADENSSIISSAVIDPSIVIGDVQKFVIWVDANSRFELMDATTSINLLRAESWGLLVGFVSSGIGIVALSGSQDYTITAGSSLYWEVGGTAPTTTPPSGAYARIGVSPAPNVLFIEKDYEPSIGQFDFKGYYVSAAALETAFPAASHDGAWAVVKTSANAVSGLYEAVSSTWTQRLQASNLSSGVIDALLAASGTPTTGNPFILDDDARLSDSRTPTAHSHTLSDVTDSGTAATLNVPSSGDAASGEVVKGNDSRLTDNRTPTAHNHTLSEITDKDDIQIEVAGLLNASTDHSHYLRLSITEMNTLVSTGTLATVTSESAGGTPHTHDVDLTFNTATGAFGATISVASAGGHAGTEHTLFIGGSGDGGGGGGAGYTTVVNTGDWTAPPIAESGYETFYEATVTHNLGLTNMREFVAQFSDTDGWLVQLDVKATSANAFKIFSVVSLNNLKVTVR